MTAAAGPDPQRVAATSRHLADIAARSGDPAGAERFRRIAEGCDRAAEALRAAAAGQTGPRG